jgi:hypothetical protein
MSTDGWRVRIEIDIGKASNTYEAARRAWLLLRTGKSWPSRCQVEEVIAGKPRAVDEVDLKALFAQNQFGALEIGEVFRVNRLLWIKVDESNARPGPNNPRRPEFLLTLGHQDLVEPEETQ